MYKSAEQYLGPSSKNSMLMDPYGNRANVIGSSRGSQPRTLLYNSYTEKIYKTPVQKIERRDDVDHKPHIKWETHKYTAMTDPRVWGRPFWFSLHSSAAHYPVKASNMVRDLMVGRLLALPIEIPCAKCRPHASAFIEANKHRLPDICSGRDKLFNFYVDFHNKVNQRYDKPTMSYEDARKIWMEGIEVTTMSYV